MKKIFNQLFLLSALAIAFASCKKDENKVYYEGGTEPTLTASTSNALVLLLPQKNDPAVTFNWTNPDYRFTTGISSQSVLYTLQIDTTGSNFTTPTKGEVSLSGDLTKGFTVAGLNTILLAIGLLENMPHEVEFRIKSNLIGGSGVLYSNVVKLTVTPYLDVVYPVPANLYITGSATPASWQCGCGEPELLSQKFTKVSSSKFVLTIALSANNSYLLLPVYGSWSAKYGGTGSNNSNNVNGDNFKPDGGDLLSPPNAGVYTITVDFKTGKFTLAQ